MAGAFVIARDIFENPIWTRNTEFRLFFLILGKAIYLDEGYDIGGIHLNKGQWLRSYRNLQADLEYIENHAIKRPGLATVKRTIDKLVADERITIEPCEHGTLFTVLNYAKYQNFEVYKKRTRNNAKNSDGTDAEQMRNNNNQGNQDKKEENIYSAPFETLWSIYPKKRNKEQTRSAFEKLMKTGEDFDLVMCGVKGYAKNCTAEGTESKFIANGSTFLNQQRYKEYSGTDTEGGAFADLFGEEVTILI